MSVLGTDAVESAGQVAAWYTVVIFTASIQEYADPVIDWLDQGKGLITARLFREVGPVTPFPLQGPIADHSLSLVSSLATSIAVPTPKTFLSSPKTCPGSVSLTIRLQRML